MGGVFLRLGDRNRRLDVEPRGVAVDRVAPVLAAPRRTQVPQPDSAGRAGVRDHCTRDGAPRIDLQAHKFVVRDHEVPNFVVLPSDHPIITVPHNARLDDPPLALAHEDAETIQARRQAVMDSDLFDLIAVPGTNAYGTPVGDDPLNRHVCHTFVSSANADPKTPDDPRPPQEAVALQYDPGGVVVDVTADDGKAAHVDHGVRGEDQTESCRGRGGDVIDEVEPRIRGGAEVPTRRHIHSPGGGADADHQPQYEQTAEHDSPASIASIAHNVPPCTLSTASLPRGCAHCVDAAPSCANWL